MCLRPRRSHLSRRGRSRSLGSEPRSPPGRRGGPARRRCGGSPRPGPSVARRLLPAPGPRSGRPPPTVGLSGRDLPVISALGGYQPEATRFMVEGSEPHQGGGPTGELEPGARAGHRILAVPGIRLEAGPLARRAPFEVVLSRVGDHHLSGLEVDRLYLVIQGGATEPVWPPASQPR